MRTGLLASFVLLFGASATLFGQELAGTWQGDLAPRPGVQSRIVFKIASAPDGKFTGQAFLIDGPVDLRGQALPISEIAVEGRTNLKLKLASIRASYDGTFAAAGDAINGRLTQEGMPLPLNLNRATPQSAWSIPVPPVQPKPMDPAADPEIEVATVKPSPPDADGRGYNVRGLQVRAFNVSLLNLIAFAYDLHERQVSGGPAWMSSDKFEITIKPATPGEPNVGQLKKLLQKVLADRFQLKFHTEKRELNVYAITLPANTKHKLTESATGGNLPDLLFRGPGLLPARNATMTDLAEQLQSVVMDRPVINQTTITGRYDFRLNWTPDEFQFAGLGPLPPIPLDTGKPNIFQAFQEQLGLRLEATKAPADVLIIDKAEKPSDN